MPARISQLHSEVFGIGIPKVRVSQLHSEVFSVGVPKIRVSQLHGEVLGIEGAAPIQFVRTTQLASELLIRGTPTVRATQISSELLAHGIPIVRVTQISGEILQSIEETIPYLRRRKIRRLF